jgi:hypothetical protein
MAEEIIYPYNFGRHAVDLQVEEVLLDGDPAERIIDPVTHTAGLRGIENWNEARFRVRATVNPERLQTLFPEEELSAPPQKMLIAFQCYDSKWRDGVNLEAVEAGIWEGEIAVRRRDVLGVVHASAYLVRTARGRSNGGRFASEAYVRVADSREWKIVLDKQVAPPGGYLDVRWADFATYDYVKLNSHPDLVYYLDYDRNPPRLWVNEGITGLRAVLSSEATRGLRAAIRDVVFGSIAQSVWFSLAVNSLLSIPAEAEEPELDWQQSVLQQFRQYLIPHVPDPVEAVRDPGQAPTLVDTLGAAVQTMRPLHQHVARLLVAAAGEEEQDA